MSIRKVVVCDGCGKVIEKTSECYKLSLKTDKFWDGVDMERNLIHLDFCPICARSVKETLRKIAKSLERRDEGE